MSELSSDPLIWLHIGTAKSGTTALQHSFRDNSAALEHAGLHYFCVGRHSSANKLAISINRNRKDDIRQIRESFDQVLKKAKNQVVFVSSEMFFGMAPEKVFDALPVLRSLKVNILVYLRRQDRYIESKYLQKMKNGRFSGSIDDYITKFSGSGSDYYAELELWRTANCALYPRICERDKLWGGSTISDALFKTGFSTLCDHLVVGTQENTSPSLGRVQLMQALDKAGFENIRRIQRALPPDSAGKARIFTLEERLEYLRKYEQSNEKLAKAYFCGNAELFDHSGLTLETAPMSSGYTQAQIEEITRIFKVLHQTHIQSAPNQVGASNDE